MPGATSPIPPLAGAFLALADDGAPAGPHPLRRRAAAVLGVLVIASSVPVAWAAPATVGKREQPAATLTSKSATPSPAGDDEPGA